MALLFAVSNGFAAGFFAPPSAMADSLGRTRTIVMMPASKGPFKLPQKPADFDGAQWAPTEFLPFPITVNVKPAADAIKEVMKEEPVPAESTAPSTADEPAVAAPSDPKKSTFTVTMNSPDGATLGSFECPPDMYMLDAVDELEPLPDALADLPYACRAGSCSACAGKVISGTVDASDCAFLSEDQKADGFVLTCTARPTSDCVIAAHAEDDLY